MTKYNDAYPNDPWAATAAAVEDAVAQRPNITTMDELHELGAMIYATADEGGPGPHHRIAQGWSRTYAPKVRDRLLLGDEGEGEADDGG